MLGVRYRQRVCSRDNSISHAQGSYSGGPSRTVEVSSSRHEQPECHTATIMLTQVHGEISQNWETWMISRSWRLRNGCKKLMLITDPGQAAAESSTKHAHLANSGLRDAEEPEWNVRSILFGDGTVGKDRKIWKEAHCTPAAL